MELESIYIPPQTGGVTTFNTRSGTVTLNSSDVDTAGGGLKSNPLSQFASTTSSQLAGVISDETGTGALVFGTAPTLSNPIVGTQTTTDNSTKAASTAYVTTAIANAVAGVNPAVAVQVATFATLPNSPTYNNGVSGIGAFLTTVTLNTALVVDGYTAVLNDRILVKNQGSAFQNGVYFVSQVAAVGLAWILTRALDYDMPSDINNTGAIPVVSGAVNALSSWLLTSSVVTVGTDSLTYTQFSYGTSTSGISGALSANVVTVVCASCTTSSVVMITPIYSGSFNNNPLGSNNVTFAVERFNGSFVIHNQDTSDGAYDGLTFMWVLIKS